MATLHLIAGLPATGKTTYANGLSARTGAVVCSLDRWLITAFGRYDIAAIGHGEHTRRVLASRELIWWGASELLKRSADVVLDDGFFLREHRSAHVALAAALGAGSVIHHIDAPLDVVRARIEQRNRQLPPYNFQINPDLLGLFVSMFETPAAVEGASIVRVGEVAGGVSR